ncbi:MAG: hypothetical protein C4329_07435 [Chitinophagaceae bacterium]
MKKTLLIAFAVFITSFGFAQQLLVHNSGNNLYIEHKVAPKENFYSVSRLYAVAPKEIAEYNKLDMKHGLTIGQVIRIPLSTTNFSQTTDTGKPVYYEVGAKEGLYRVSLKNNNVLMANLRKWNHLQNDNIKTGEKLIVGFINADASQNAVAVNNASAKTEVPKDVIKKEEKPAEEKKPEPIVEKKMEEKKAEQPKPQPIETKPTQTQPVYAGTYNSNDGGYFKKEFEQQTKAHPVTKDKEATTSIFKTASGWQDGKYYAMINGVEPGSIIKIVNPSNNKVVYAKVLSAISGIRQNQGLDLRISNAAASALEVQDTEKFVVKVNY